MTKEFTLYTNADGERAGNWPDDAIVIPIFNANQLLNDRGQRVLTPEDDHVKSRYWCNDDEWKDEKLADDEALMICARPIEKEKPECDHVYKREVATAITNGKCVETYNNDFCPKCGKDLK